MESPLGAFRTSPRWRPRHHALQFCGPEQGLTQGLGVQSQTDMSATSTTLRAERPRQQQQRPRASKRNTSKQQPWPRQPACAVPIAAQPMHGTHVRGGPIFVVPAGANAWSYVNANYFHAAGGHIEASGTSPGADGGAHAVLTSAAPIIWDRQCMPMNRTTAATANETSTLPPLSAGPPPPAALQSVPRTALGVPAASAVAAPASSCLGGGGASESTNSGDLLDYSMPEFLQDLQEDVGMLIPDDEETAAAQAVLGQDSFENLFAGVLLPAAPTCCASCLTRPLGARTSVWCIFLALRSYSRCSVIILAYLRLGGPQGVLCCGNPPVTGTSRVVLVYFFGSSYGMLHVRLRTLYISREDMGLADCLHEASCALR